jgi:lysophospholipase L1-like esterase
LLVGLLTLELGCRLHRGAGWLMYWGNIVDAAYREEAMATDALAVRDPLLGTRPNPKVDRLMLLGVAPSDTSGTPLLATGDSFTYGEDVDMLESWPALLQDVLHRRVLNGGVSAYGLDQTVLRTELLARMHQPTAIVVSFIADDLWRLDMRRVWGRDKPYFTLATDGTLVLHPPSFEPAHLSFWQRAFGWSVLLQTVNGRLSWHDEWTSDSVRAPSAGDGERLVCPLMHRLAQIGVPTLVVAQYESTLWLRDDAVYTAHQLAQTRLALDCTRKAGLLTFDTYDVIVAAVRRDGAAALYNEGGHHTASGNRVVAGAIAEELGRRGMLHK